MTTEKIIQQLINGNTAVVKDEHKAEVQKRLREIKKNCTLVERILKFPLVESTK